MATKSNDIRIRNLSNDRYKSLKAIASYFGLSMGTFVKTELLKIIEQYPDHIKNFRHEA